MTAPAPEVLLTMPARPEGVGVVRQALAGMADALDFDASVLADMKMAVTEACTNVVVHAYDEDAGMLEVEMLADEAGLTIVVRDHGAGIQPRPARSEPPALGPRPAADRRALGRVRAQGLGRPGHRGAHDLLLRAHRDPARREPGHRERRRRRALGPGRRRPPEL